MARVLRSLTTTVRGAPGRSVLGVVAFLALSGAWLWRSYLLTPGPDQLLVDLDVYREAGMSALTGRPVYEWLTPVPQLLPFTYPPIAAVLAIPLVFVPFPLLGALWTLAQIAVLAGVVTVAYRPLLDRFGRWRPVALGVLCAALLWLLPVEDSIRFGQVDIFLVGLCLADYVTRQPRWPRGMLIGIATAVKLTPGVFIVHLWLAGRRREAVTAAGTATALTLAGFAVIPADSADFWFRAIFDSERLGSNTGTSNQAIRGILLRFGPDSSLLWLAVAAVVAVVGFRYAVRASRRGHDLGACALVGLLAVVLSPVAWIHHLCWVVLALAVVVGDGRDRSAASDDRLVGVRADVTDQPRSLGRRRVPRRLFLGGALWLFFFLSIPWFGASLADPLRFPDVPIVAARIVQGAFGLMAIVLLPVLDRLIRADAAVTAEAQRPAPRLPSGSPQG
jgi:alpha-1,2-mannosyltransferase